MASLCLHDFMKSGNSIRSRRSVVNYGFVKDTGSNPAESHEFFLTFEVFNNSSNKKE